jgi:hypothetical protein
MNTGFFSDMVATLMRVTGSAMIGNVVTVGGVGLAGSFDSTVDDPEDGEQFDEQTVFGGLGLIFRPRPPEQLDGEKVNAEAYGVRKGDTKTPWTWRDLRLHKRFPNPKAGTIALVGYGGGFLSFDDPADGTGNGGVSTWYLPYAFSNGVPTKAHAISLSGDGHSLSIIQGDGLALTMDPDNGITMRADSQTWLTLAPGKFNVFAAATTIQGNVTLGQNPLTASPVLPAIATLASPSVFLSIA